MFKNLKENKGTALIIALLVMGILTAVSLAVSALVVREIGVTKMALDAGKAYYAAESGIEIGLLKIKENAPGWEPADVVSAGVSEGQDFRLTLKNKADSYPYLDSAKYDLEGAEAEAFYDVLELNESVTIPLFTVDKDEKEVKVEEFRVYFYVNFRPDDLNFDSLDLSGWDILRWKIYGLTKEPAVPGITESINDFTAVSNDTAGGFTNAGKPSWFGSVDCNTDDESLSYGKVGCTFYESQIKDEKVDSTNKFDIYAGTCWPTEAREHYYYENENVEAVQYCYPIRDFLIGHSYNYLTLTNLMNPAVFEGKSKAEGLKLSRLYFRVEAYDGDGLPMEYANLDSVGESGGSRVKLNALKKKGGQLPVFNFALYHTKGD